MGEMGGMRMQGVSAFGCRAELSGMLTQHACVCLFRHHGRAEHPAGPQHEPAAVDAFLREPDAVHGGQRGGLGLF